MSTTSSGGESTEALNGKLTFEQSKNRIVGRDGDNLIRLLILADGSDFVMKISKEGFDATTASDDELVFNSNQNVFKIVKSGTTTLTVPSTFSSGSVLTATIPHELTSKPAFIAWVDIPVGDGSSLIQGKLVTLPAMIIPATGPVAGSVRLYITADVDATNLYLRVANTTGLGLSGVDGDYIFKYYILQETAN